jgi:hypothetical protein
MDICTHVWAARYLRGRNGETVEREECLRCERPKVLPTARPPRPAPTRIPGDGVRVLV